MAEEEKPKQEETEEGQEKAAVPPSPPPPAPAAKASGKAIAALVLGILGIVCCSVLGPVAWIIGSQEKKAIAEGRSSEAGQTLATIGWILGIIGTVILILAILWAVFWGGLAIIQSMTQGGGY